METCRISSEAFFWPWNHQSKTKLILGVAGIRKTFWSHFWQKNSNMLANDNRSGEDYAPFSGRREYTV